MNPSATNAPGSLWARLGSYGLLLLTALFILLTFDQHGISNDEEVQHVYGRLLLDFYNSGLSDHSAFSYKNLYLYGGFFDLIAASLERLVPMDVWDLRHLLSGLFGLLGLIGTWKLARLLAGDRVGFLAVLLLVLTGSWSGAMFTHTKDIPFATCMTWALYFTTRLGSELPRPSLSLLLKLGLALGCAFGLRVGAVFAVFYLGLSLLLWNLVAPVQGGQRLQRLLISCLSLWPAALLAVLLMGLFWPWSVMGVDHLYQAATAFSHFSFDLFTILDGSIYKNGDVPSHYLLTYLLVRLPELSLLGLLGALVFAGINPLPRNYNTPHIRQPWLWLPLLLAVAVPLAYTLASRPALYNGIRHFTFLVPPVTILAAWGLCRLGLFFKRFKLALVFMLLVLGFSLYQLNVFRTLHPYEYIQYNRLAGGVERATGRWELDYWSDALREGAQHLNAYVARETQQPAQPYPVAVCAESIQGSAYLDPKLFEVTKDWRKAEFFLSTTHMDCHKAMQGRLIGQIERVGVPLLIILDRRGLSPEARQPK